MKKAVIDYKFDGVIRIIALFAISLCVSVFPYSFVLSDIPGGWALSLLAGFVFFFAGYGLQMLAAKLFHYTRVKSDGSYENSESFFQGKKAVFGFLTSLIPTIIMVVILAVIIYSDKEMAYYFGYLPWVLGIFTYGISFAGVICWFYPVERLCDIRAISFCTLLDFAVYIIVVFLMQRHLMLISMLTNMKNAIKQLNAGATFNVYGIVIMALVFVILLVLHFVHDRHYEKLNSLMKDYVHEQRRATRKKWEPKD